MATLDSRVKKLETDMYFGDGMDNPPITTRLDRVEHAISTMNRLTWAIIAATLVALGDIVNTHLMHLK